MADKRKKPDEQARNKKTGRFKPGQSGNPGGRPKGRTSFRKILEKVGGEPTELERFKGMTKDEAIARLVYEDAEGGDKWSRQFIVERKEGKPGQQIDIVERDPDEVIEIG